MKERELMEKNLARLLREVDYRSCGSDAGQQREDAPSNPFMKRVFEKKLRRSSVASENMNPNIIYTEKSLQLDEFPQLDQIVQKAHSSLETFKMSTKARIENINNKHFQTMAVQKLREVIEKLKNNIQQANQQMQEYSSKNNKKLINNISIAHIENYQCPNNYSQDKQSNLKKNQIKPGRSKRLSGSMVSQPITYKTTQPKSIYESVLEQRRNKKTKKSKMI